MNRLYIPIGISGSGKTTLGNKLKSKVVCPDDIRKELTGNISNQSNNKEVFETAYDKIATYLAGGFDVYFSATNLHCKPILELIKKYKYNKIVIINMLDSLNPLLCKERVENDLKNKIERSNTLVKITENEDVIDIQYKKYIEQIKHFKDFFNNGTNQTVYIIDYKNDSDIEKLNV